MSVISSTEYETSMDELNTTDDNTTLGHCLPHLLRGIAESHFNSKALVCGETQLTYGEVNSLATSLAHVLVDRGIEHGNLVGVALDRSVDLVVVLLAVLKAGAAYLPIDPSFPADRVGCILEDAQPKLVIVDAEVRHVASLWHCRCLDLEEVRGSMTSFDPERRDPAVDLLPEDLAYVIYTSGSTGKPKGVEISHGALCNLLLGMQRLPGCCEGDRLLAITTISFDIAALELFLPLLCGATVVLAMSHETKNPELLLGLIQRLGITMMQATPATWQMLLDSSWPGEPKLSKILCGGDILPRRLADRLVSCAESVWNMYGPTEATVWASVWRVCKGEDVVIGKPIVNYKLYVLDGHHLPVPAGSDGELYIGGASLARGYRNRPEMTRARFIDNPFHQGLMYQTGDIAKYDHQGRLTVLGRADGQVKIRGHRIELGDIEAALTDHVGISDAVAVSRDNRLVAYYIAISHEETDGPSLEASLRQWLSERLPAYMMPAFFVGVKAFPTTLNNKIDRKALPDPVAQVVQPAATRAMTGIESTVHTVWVAVLGHDRISPDDNFFQIGGDSVRVVRVQKELEKLFGRPISPTIMFEHYTIMALAAYLERVGEPVPQPRHSRRAERDSDDIAVIGMSCRLPGGVTSPEEYWEMLAGGLDVTSEVPSDRWDVDALFSTDPADAGKSYCRRGGFLSSVDDFDASFFGISPREARAMDPAQRLMLETCWEGFERAGYTHEQLRGSQTGVYIGVCNISAHSNTTQLDRLDGFNVTGTAGGTMSGRVSYVLGLEGPSMTIDAACASSLVTTHLACNALRQRECDMALTGGVTLLLHPGMHIEFSRLQGMSSDGRCRAFAEHTNGTAWAEGCTMLLLKRMSDAVRDGDDIHAVVKGTAVNHAGRSAAGLTVPSGPAQQRLINTALAASELQPADIDYIEAHGTGTQLGDPIEASALAAVYGGGSSTRLRSEPLWLGSVKSNLGHTQAAAGLAGMIKVILSMQRRELPRTLHVHQAMCSVDWTGANMALVKHHQAWQPHANRPRRAGISAFGIGGTNAHVVVEEAPSKRHTAKTSVPLPPELPFTLSSQTDAGLLEQADRLRRHIENGLHNSNDRLAEVAYSLATTRTHFRRRLVLLANDKAALLKKLGAVSGSQCARNHFTSPRIAILFTGQGSQVLGMGKDLYATYPVFRDSVGDIMSHFAALGTDQTPLKDVLEAAPGSQAAALLHRTDFAQPALFALEVALWHLWQSWGVRPNLVLGHSIGEFAAAHVAGVFNLPDACRLVAARGRLMHAVPTRGGMLSLEASAEEATTAIECINAVGRVSVACHNTPTQTVVSGDTDAIQQLDTYFANLSRKTKSLDVSHAFHSHHMDCMLAELHAVAQTVQFNPPTISIVSSMTGNLAKAGELEQPDYWVSQVRQTVRFVEGVQTLHRQHVTIYLELGPKPVLAGLGAACLAEDKSLMWLPSLVPGKCDVVVMQRSLAEMHLQHIPIDWIRYFEPFGCKQRVKLPTYAFQKEHFVPLRPIKYETSCAKQQKQQQQQQQQQQSRLENLQPSADRFAFEIEWQQADVNPDLAASRPTVLGLLCPVANSTEAWANSVRAELALIGTRLIPIKNIEDANIHNVDGVLCLWHSSSIVDPLKVPDEARNLVAKGLGLLQAAVKIQLDIPLVWATRSATGVHSEDQTVTGIAASPLWGLMRTARNEHPELQLRLIDMGTESFEGLASALLLSDEPESALRQGCMLVPRMHRMEPVTADRPFVSSFGSVLITGGLGNLGQRVARWLVEVHAIRDLVLTSRQGMQAPGAQQVVAEMTALGARVTVVPCDMGSLESVRLTVALFEGRQLRGVVHAAGSQDNGVLTALTPKRCNTVLEPKVNGAWYLHQLTQNMNLDFFVLFSSISGIMGLPGHANYAAANTFLDSIAHFRRAQGLPATAIAYGTWAGDGMASRILDSTMARLTQSGLDKLAPEDGLALFEKAIHGGRALTVAAALNQERMQSYHDNQSTMPALLRSLLRPISCHNVHDGAVRNALRAPTSLQRSDTILSMVQDTVAKTLGFQNSSDVDVDCCLQDIGVDSLTAVLIRNQLADLTGLRLTARFVFEHADLRALSQFLTIKLDEEDSDSTLSTNATSITPASDQSWLDMNAVRKGCLDSAFTFANTNAAPIAPRTTFVTGATGFVGAHITAELLASGIEVYCLIRADSDDRAMQRLRKLLAEYKLWTAESAPFLHAIAGDMGLPLFGLSEDRFAQLANQVDSICHAGGLVDWMRALDEYIEPNVVSAHEVLRLASQGKGKDVHLVSTMSTIPKYLGYDLKPNDQEYGYSTSKYIAERMVVAARWRGARTCIYRLPFIAASSKTGQFRQDRGDFWHNLVAGCIEIGAFPITEASMSAVLPVDYVARTVTSIMTQDLDRIGRDYNFSNERAMSYNEFFRMVDDATGCLGQGLLPFVEWREKAFAYAARNSASSIARIITLLDDITDDKQATDMISGWPVIDPVLGTADLPVPALDESFVQKYVRCIANAQAKEL